MSLKAIKIGRDFFSILLQLFRSRPTKLPTKQGDTLSRNEHNEQQNVTKQNDLKRQCNIRHETPARRREKNSDV